MSSRIFTDYLRQRPKRLEKHFLYERFDKSETTSISQYPRSIMRSYESYGNKTYRDSGHP